MGPASYITSSKRRTAALVVLCIAVAIGALINTYPGVFESLKEQTRTKGRQDGCQAGVCYVDEIRVENENLVANSRAWQPPSEDAVSALATIATYVWQHDGALPPAGSDSDVLGSDGGASTSTLDFFRQETVPFYVEVRRDGIRLHHTWNWDDFTGGAHVDTLTSVRSTLARIKALVADREASGGAATHIAFDFTHDYTDAVPYADVLKKRVHYTANKFRGKKGFDMTHVTQNRTSRYAALNTLTSNRSIEKQVGMTAMTYLGMKHKQDGLAMSGDNLIVLRQFSSAQALVKLETAVGVPMSFGTAYVPASAVTRDGLKQMIDMATYWLVNNVDSKGKLTYKYWPSTGEHSTANNMIRQWMATVCLDKIGWFLRGVEEYDANSDSDSGRLPPLDYKPYTSDAIFDVARRNIEYNLKQYFHMEGDKGVIEWTRKSKLGAISIAGVALLEHRDRADFAKQEAALRVTVNSLFHADTGKLDSWYKHYDGLDKVKEQNNFYPGEGLYYWAHIAEREAYDDDELISKIMKGFSYYRAWHMQPRNRNPAFVPWHTMAYYRVWKHTRADELRDFIFEMNDWLVATMLQWHAVDYPEFKGRYYSHSPYFGVPHASSTGVYLEGLIDAWRLARDVGETRRQEAYRQAIAKGLRHLMQLQYVRDDEMWYMSKRAPVHGGFRTQVYNNEIRCDNIQHGLEAMLEIMTEFSHEDYVIVER